MNERQRTIIGIISEEHSVRVDALAEKFKVSTETIRRDLKYLEEQGQLRRVHGGAVRETGRSGETVYEKRSTRNIREKIELARMASALVDDGDTVAIGNGTTMIEFAKAISGKNNLTIITNSLEAAAECVKNETNSVYILGGLLRKDGLSVSGSVSLKMAEEFRVDKCFFGVGGINSENAVTDYHVEESALTRTLLNISNIKIGLMDYSKLSNTGLKKICDVKDLDILLVDWNVPGRRIAQFKECGVKVISARHPENRGLEKTP